MEGATVPTKYCASFASYMLKELQARDLKFFRVRYIKKVVKV